MEKKVKLIRLLKAEYRTILDIENDDWGICEQLETEYQDGYICDMIQEVADSRVSVYTSTILENANDLNEYVEEAIAEGLICDLPKDNPIITLLQMGWYKYNLDLLYHNLEDIIYNKVVEQINDHLELLERENKKVTDEQMEELENLLDEKIGDYDNNSRFEDLEELADEIIKEVFEDEDEDEDEEDEI